MGNKFYSVNPATEEVLGEWEYESLDSAIEKARALHESAAWPRLSAKQRAAAFKKLAAELRADRHECALLISKEMGKPIKQALSEIEKCAWVCDYFADNAEEFLEHEHIVTEFRKSYLRIDPLGVILGVMPWNFPFWQVFRFAIPALLAGNRIVVKHASNVPLCALKMEKIFNNALPADTYKNIFLPGNEVSFLIDSDYVAAVSVTGSTYAGAKVAEAAGKNVKKSVLELGGSDPFIILDDADLDACCTTAVTARFLNSGQSCIATKRFIVQKGIAKSFTEKFVEKVEALKMGNPLNEDTDVGPLARGDLRDELKSIVEQSVEMGARVLIGNHAPEGKGFFYAPTVLVEVTEDMPVLREETFGPVAPIIVVETGEEAIKIANNSEYGLAASVWSNDILRAEKIAAKLEAGFVAINDNVKSDPRLPFGGIKKSGYGRELSYLSVREFANVKTVVVK